MACTTTKTPQMCKSPGWNSGFGVAKGTFAAARRGFGDPCRRAPITKCLVLSMHDLVLQCVLAVFAEFPRNVQNRDI